MLPSQPSPSSVAERAVTGRLSFERSRFEFDLAELGISSSTRSSGFDDRPAGAVDDHQLVVPRRGGECSATTAGMLMQAPIAVWLGRPADIGDETSHVVVAKADGVGGGRSCATDGSPGRPCAASADDPACQTGTAQCVRYLDFVGLALAQVGIPISARTARRHFLSCCTSAHSALQRRSSISMARSIIGSSSNIMCQVDKAPTSARPDGGPPGPASSPRD